MLNLEAFKSVDHYGVKELADAAAAVLRSSGTSQDKGTVAEYPNERTIRYYLAEGLIAQPIEKRGTSSVFGYEHLLAVLAIKKLQSDGLPISVIKTLIEGKGVNELEMILGAASAYAPPEDWPAIGESLADGPLLSTHSSVEEVQFSAALPEVPAGKKNSAKEYLESLLLGGRRSETGPPPQRPVAASAPTTMIQNAPARWQRHEIEPGLELHVRDDYQAPTAYRQMKRLLDTIKRLLQR
ncbi:MAG: MerR family transcriptional regulator [Acidobacteriota bacterium]